MRGLGTKEEDTETLSTMTGFDKFLADLKVSTFQVLYIALKEDENSLFGMFIDNATDYVQMLQFVFHAKIMSVWKASGFLSVIFNIGAWLNISAYFSGTFTYTLFLMLYYFCVAIILLMVLDIIYVSYSYHKQKFTMIWPLSILRNVVTLSVTLFYLLITQFMTNIIQCQPDSTGTIQVLVSYPTVQCWAGMHILHAVIGIISIIVFVAISIIVALNYFESRTNSTDPSARSNSRADVAFALNKIILQATFSFIPAQWDWPLVLLTFSFGTWQWYLYQFDDPYYNETASKMFKTFNAYYMWTCTMLLICKILEKTSFSAGLMCWLLGCPFICIIVLSQSNRNLKNLAKNEIKFDTDEELLKHLRLLEQIIDAYKTDKNSYLLLAGYIEQHKDVCLEDDCPLKTTKKRKKDKIPHQNQANESAFEDSVKQLYYVMDRMYILGLKTFKKSCKLRISYSFFCLGKMENRDKALYQLAAASKLKPRFDEEFLIFRYTKIIKDQNADNRGANLDVLETVSSENSKKQCLESIKEAAEHHKSFWLELLEDEQNMQKLSSLGSKIDSAINNSKTHWKSLVKLKQDNPSFMMLYGKFCVHVLNEKGDDLIRKSKKMAYQQLESMNKKFDDIDNLADPVACLLTGSSKNELGYGKKINSIFIGLFGLYTDDIVEKKINILMPKLFSEVHDAYLKLFQMAENENENENIITSNYLDKEHKFFCKNKAGYIFQAFVKTKLLELEEGGDEQMTFMTTFRTEPQLKPVIHFMIDNNDHITDMTSSALPYFNFTSHTIEKGVHKIREINNKITVDSKFYKKEGENIEYLCKDGKKRKFNVHLEPLYMKYDKPINSQQVDQKEMFVDGNLVRKGNIVRLENLSYNDEIISQGAGKDDDTATKNEMDDRIKQMREEYEDRDIMDILNEAYNMNERLDTEERAQLHRNNKKKKTTVLGSGTEDYGEDVITKRLIDGKLYDVELLDIDEDKREPELDIDTSVFRQRYKESHLAVEKSRNIEKLIKRAISNVREMVSIRFFKVISLLWIIAIAVMSSMQLVDSNNFFAITNTLLDMTLNANKQLALFSRINSALLDFEYLNSSLYIENNLVNYSDVFDRLNFTASLLVNNSKSLIDSQYLSVIGHQNDQFLFYDYNSIYTGSMNSSFTVSFINDIDLLLSTLMNFTAQFTTVAQVKTLVPNDLVAFKFNFYRYFRPQMNAFSSQLLQYMLSKTSSILATQGTMIILLVIEAFISIVFVLYFIWLKNRVLRKKSEILFLFLDIPRSNVLTIFKKCESFLNFCNVFMNGKEVLNKYILESSDEDNNSFEIEMNKYVKVKEHEYNEEDIKMELYENQTKKNRIRRKYIKRSGEGFSNWNILFFSLVAIGFGIGTVITLYFQQTNLNYNINQIFSNTLVESTFYECMNFLRQALINPSYMVVANVTAMQMVGISLNNYLQIDIQLFAFQQHIASSQSTFSNQFEQTYFSNLCATLNADSDPACRTAASGNLINGLIYTQNHIFNFVEAFYSQMIQNATSSLNQANNSIANGSDPTSSRTELQSIDYAISNYIAPSISLLIQQERAELQSDSDSINRVLVIVLVFYVISLVIFYLAWAYPLAIKFHTEIKVTFKMLNMIPISVIQAIPTISNYLLDWSRKNNNLVC